MAKAKKSDEPKGKRGRPSLKSPEIEAEIIERIANGEPMAAICRSEHMPEYRTVNEWMRTDEVFSAGVARAREAGHDRIAADCLEIADNATNDWMERNEEGGDAGYRLNGEHVQRSKLRIETRLKLLKCWDPKRYGDKVQTELSGPDGGPITTRALDDDTLKARIAALVAKNPALADVLKGSGAG